MKEKIKRNGYYILFSVIIILIIIIGFIYSKNTTYKYVEEEPIKEEQEVIEKEFYVEVKGEVKNPGVYKIEENKRIIDVISKAGGLTKNANTSYLNLSKKVVDEMVIIIYSQKEIEEYNKNLDKEKEVLKYIEIEKECVCPNTNNDACINKKEEVNNTPKGNTTSDLKEQKLININSATIEELTSISGVGESKAKAIIEYRETTKFKVIDDIKNVTGIGDSLFEKIKDYITV